MLLFSLVIVIRCKCDCQICVLVLTRQPLQTPFPDLCVCSACVLQKSFTNFVSHSLSLAVCVSLLPPPLAVSLSLMYSRFLKANLSLKERKASWGQLAASTIFNYHTLFTFSQMYSRNRKRGRDRGRERVKKRQKGSKKKEKRQKKQKRMERDSLGRMGCDYACVFPVCL